jgi:hypothetical protein
MKKILPMFIAFLILAVFVSAAPVISGVSPSYNVNEGQLLEIKMNVSGAETLTTSAAFGTLTQSGTPVSSAVFAWTPLYTQAGTYSVSFNASNGTDSDVVTTSITVVDVPSASYKMASSTLTLGGKSQKRSNPNADDDDDQEVNVTGSITISNLGDKPLSGFTYAVNPIGFSLTDLKTSITFSSQEVLPNGQITANVVMKVPKNLASRYSDGTEAVFKVATVTFNANGTSTTSDVEMQAKNELEIDNAEVTINDDDSQDLDNGDEVDNLKPDDEVKIVLTIKNLFKNADDVEIQDISARLEIGGDLDVDEEEDISDLGPGDTDTATITFTVDSDAEEGTYDGLLTVEGTDENDAKYTILWDVEFTVERENHEITISSYSFTPSSLTCDNSVSLKVTMKNTGKRDEEEVSVHVESAELKFGNVINDINMDEGDTVSKTFVIPVPANIALGNARVIIKTYYDTDKSSDSETAVITKSACSPTTPVEQPASTTPQQPIIVVTQPQQNQTSVVAEPVEEENSFMGSTGYTALLILGYIVVIVAGIYLIAKVLRK